jgi:AcrR family transcriptional regulator
MGRSALPGGRRDRGKQDKRARIMAAARELFASRGVDGVTTQQIADRADVAIGTLYLYTATKAELLIMVQNEKFAAAIDDGLASAAAAAGQGPFPGVIALIRPVVECVREHSENGRTYLHELMFGDPKELYRSEGLALSARLENGVTSLLTGEQFIDAAEAATLARIITAIIHVSTTATVFLHRRDAEVLVDIQEQIRTILAPHHARGSSPPTTT